MARSGQGDHASHVTPEDVRRLCEFLYRRTGMLFSDDKRYYIDRRLNERMAASGSPSFQSYFALLRSDFDREIEHLVNAFTVNETYFFREEHQLRCMTSDLLRSVIRDRRPDEPIRIWSVPCSTGEEPYSIAIFVFSAVFVALGVALLVRTASGGGGVVGYVIGALFIVLGVARFTLERQRVR